MAKLKHLDLDKGGITFYPMIDYGGFTDCTDFAPLSLNIEDSKKLINYIEASLLWKDVFEEDLQCLHTDGNGNDFLSTLIPLNIFRYDFCQKESEHEHLPIELKDILKTLFIGSSSWFENKINVVLFDGYFKREWN